MRNWFRKFGLKLKKSPSEMAAILIALPISILLTLGLVLTYPAALITSEIPTSVLILLLGLTFASIVSTISYLAKAGDKTKARNKTKQDLMEGSSIIVAFIFAALLAGLLLLVGDASNMTGIFGFANHQAWAFLSEILFVFTFGGAAASLTSRFTRLADQNGNEREKHKGYNQAVVIFAFLGFALTAAILIADVATGGLTLGLISFLKATIALIGTVSVFTSCGSYFGKLCDIARTKTITNESVAVIAGVILGVALTVILLTVATSGFGALPVLVISYLSAIKGISALAVQVIGSILVGIFSISTCSSFCKRIGQLVDTYISSETIFHKWGWIKSSPTPTPETTSTSKPPLESYVLSLEALRSLIATEQRPSKIFAPGDPFAPLKLIEATTPYTTAANTRDNSKMPTRESSTDFGSTPTPSSRFFAESVNGSVDSLPPLTQSDSALNEVLGITPQNVY